MVKVADHFKGIDAFYINLDEAEARRESMTSTFSDVFRSLNRVKPIEFVEDAKTVGVQAKASLVEAKKLYDVKHVFKGMVMYNDILLSKFANRTFNPRAKAPWTPEDYAAQESLYRTTINILLKIVDCDFDRAIIMEDDCYVRDGLLEADIEIPDADILVWGGAFANIMQDAKKFADGKPYAFKRRTSKRRAWFAHCYEVTKAGARTMLDVFKSFPTGTVDTTWLYAFDMCKAYALEPTGIVQSGAASQLQACTRIHPKTREEAKKMIGDI